MQRLRQGEPAPEFVAKTMDGKTITLADLEGQRVLLAFRRYAACPVCNQHLASYRVRAKEFMRAGLRVIAIFHSPIDRLNVYFNPRELPFGVVSDPKFELYEAFGVARSRLRVLRPRSLAAAIPAARSGYGSDKWGQWDGTAHMIPANFLLDGATIVSAHYGRHLGDSWSVDQALAKAGEVWPRPLASAQ